MVASRGLLALFAAALLFAFTLPVGNNDIGFHLRLGREIRDSGRVPVADHHSFTADGAPFLAQEWGSEVALSLLQERFGWAGLSLAAGLCAALAFLALRAAMGGEVLGDLVLLLPVAFLASTHMMARPHVLGWLLLGVLLWRLKRGRDWEIPILLALWANLHASFLLGAGLAGLHFLEKRKWGWAAAAGLAPLLNPYGWRLYVFFLELKGLPLEAIEEFGRYPVTGGWFWLWTAYALALVAGLLKRGKPSGWIRAAVLVPAGFYGMRYAVVGAMALAPLQSALWGGVLAKAPRRILGAVLALGLIGGCWAGSRWMQSGHVGLGEEQVPVAATEFLRRHRIEGPLLNDYNFGGWLLFKGMKVFVDGRIDVYRGDPIQAYLCVSSAGEGWERALEQYGVRALMLKPERRIVKVLIGDPRWELAYFDSVAVVFLRRGEFPEVRRLRNITPLGHRDKTRVPELLGEIRYLLGENERYAAGHKVLAILLYRSGDPEGARREMLRFLELRPRGRELEDARELMAKLGMR